MKLADAFDLMEELRAEGWLVVLKCLPHNLPWIIEGSRSEYDAPSPDQGVGRGKWCAEVQWLGEGHKHSQARFGDTPMDAMRKVLNAVREGK